MALKALHKPSKTEPKKVDGKISEFISKGGTLAKAAPKQDDENHRLTLRIPLWLLDKIDSERKERVGKISRNLWILETLERATKDQD